MCASLASISFSTEAEYEHANYSKFNHRSHVACRIEEAQAEASLLVLRRRPGISLEPNRI